MTPTNPVQSHEGHSIVLVDGVCHFCQGLTKWIIKRDPEGQFHFASQQSDIGKKLLQEGGLSTDRMDTFVLIENGVYYTRSTGALRIARKLKFPYPLLYAFIAVPRFLRDAVYNYVARHRYRWFGKDEEDACRLPTPDIRERFL
ncbi:DCC1-like thiol-disulfide oxidoreductase family protein [Paenibacillus sp. JX-17]|uniref:DCC1-like thiol-disulfide oxidoreductase family protein n=1 Tax=Paenibacillus lacisoli TaxID=3064525 RepID=A0ABT9CDF1_9BACL|nr:DCC1-like thiol-disulfide oxidoreductase family protein [Paenibacillus sp. JX-17]MDO7907289.1 DCC1-like thiol-disulfide oxidoreductase family protein [Paenibacillus sp. JX-17]